jgi:Holliday junction resolvasome RuvABC endonuclease subunit
VFKRVFAIDPSLTCSGWALFALPSKKLLSIGKLKAAPPGSPLPARIADLQHQISELAQHLRLGEGDLTVCEAATTIIDPKVALLIEQVRVIFETIARSLGATVPGRIHPRTIHKFLLGMTGKQLKRSLVKEAAALQVELLFAKDLARLGFATSREMLMKNQDIVDALLIGYYTACQLTLANNSQVRLEDLFN